MAAIKGNGPRSPDVGRVQAQKGPPLNALETALLQSGIAKTPTQARVLARSLVAALKQAGFPPPPQGGAAEQIRSFQQAHGLPATGKLDDATRAKMADVGILPKDAGQPKPGDAKAPDAKLGTDARATDSKLGTAPTAPKGWADFGSKGPPSARAPSTTTTAPGTRTHVVAHEQTKARAELAKDGTPKNLAGMLDTLAQLGFFGGGKGKQRLEGALRGLQLAAGLPTTGKLDAQTVKELIGRGVLPEGTEVPQSSQPVTSSGQAPADGRGVAEGKGDARASEGRGERAGETSGARGQGGEGASGAVADGTGRVSDGDRGGKVDDDANAPAGDEDWDDARRGHATSDDDTDDDEGYYEIPPLSQQVKQALEGIARNDDENGAVTYSWDVTFHKPGVYGRRQPAEPLWHLVVDRAGAFDPVWQKAKSALTDRMREIEPEGAPPSDDDFILALRRARVREPSPS